MQQSLFPSTEPLGNFSDMNEYLLVIHPDEKVYVKVTDEKQAFDRQYNQKAAGKAKAHITIGNFLAREEMEETIIRWIQRISSQVRSFPVTFNNYSGFPAHTIYLKVQDHQPFQNLAAQLKVIDSYIRSNGYPAVRLINHPHMSIARRLPTDIYERALADYSQKIFCQSFIACELVLLRRSHQFDTCKVINIFRLLPPENNLIN